jgi:hypothetical protein
MSSKSRIAMILGSIILFGVFLFPIWRITLYAPQYPSGLSMDIWVDKITDENALKNINILNHYVGMQLIEPDSIPELSYFPIIIYILAGLGLLAAIINRRKVYLFWFMIIVALGILGMYDFYLWEYDYGHNLSDTAPIKVPGQAYQPPFIGGKWLLNFYATSYPYWGALFFALPMLLSAFAFLTKKEKKN